MNTAIETYLDSLPADRRDAMVAVRKVILKNIDKQFVEQMQYGMISWVVPKSIFPAGYHCDPKQPLNFASLGSKKNCMSLHMMFVYMNPALEKQIQTDWKAAGKKLDMGKACVRFKKLDDLPLEALGKLFKSLPVASYLENYQSAMGSRLKKTSVEKKPPLRKTRSAK